jgi:uncharacterized membrane protein YqjE
MTTANTNIDPQPDATKPKQPDKSLGELFGDLSSEFTGLVKTQVELAKVEVRSEVKKASRPAAMFGGAVLAGYMSLILLSFALAWALENVMDAGLAFLITGVLYAIVAGVLYMRARERAREVNMIPEQTVESVKEDVQWARQKLS